MYEIHITTLDQPKKHLIMSWKKLEFSNFGKLKTTSFNLAYIYVYIFLVFVASLLSWEAHET